jgi:hypothetical protein
MSKYEEVLTNIIGISGIPRKGMTMLAIWENATHFQLWAEHKDQNIKDIRIVTVPTSLLPIETKFNKNEVGIAGIAYSTKSDYSDTNLVYFMEVSS